LTHFVLVTTRTNGNHRTHELSRAGLRADRPADPGSRRIGRPRARNRPTHRAPARRRLAAEPQYGRARLQAARGPRRDPDRGPQRHIRARQRVARGRAHQIESRRAQHAPPRRGIAGRGLEPHRDRNSVWSCACVPSRRARASRPVTELLFRARCGAASALLPPAARCFVPSLRRPRPNCGSGLRRRCARR
jgi:hypothetical protein